MSEPRNAFGSPFSFELGTGWATRTLLSIGMAGFLALMGVLSFPVPWTPVPFSLMPLGLLVAGGYQRPGYAALSVAVYLLAGALGAPIFAAGESGWHHFAGATAGYLFGFILVAAMVGAYMGRPRRALTPRFARIALGLLGLGVLAGITAIVWMATTDTSLGTLQELSGWGLGASTLWIFVFLTAACGTASWWLVRQRSGQQTQALNLYIVMLASIIALHVCGVTGLIVIGGYPWMSAIILGSVVFLPFDAVKAGIAVAATLPFVPTPQETDHA